MKNLIFVAMLLVMPGSAISQEFWRSAQQCDSMLENARRNDPVGSCKGMTTVMRILAKEPSSEAVKYCQTKTKMFQAEFCEKSSNGTKHASAGKEQIYVFLYRDYKERVNPSVAIERATSFEAALAKFENSSQWVYLNRLDSDKCKKGFYILGVNNKDGNGRKPIAGFMNCGYANLDQAIDKGTRDFPIPFFNIVIGAVSSKQGREVEMACGYSGRWNTGARLGESIMVFDGKRAAEVDNLCSSLNGRYPILVDREPEQTIWVSPQ